MKITEIMKLKIRIEILKKDNDILIMENDNLKDELNNINNQ